MRLPEIHAGTGDLHGTNILTAPTYSSIERSCGNILLTTPFSWRCIVVDREAQRAVRERTKNTIERLEQRIQELTSQDQFQQLAAALKEKELIEAENIDIKRRLLSVMSMIVPIVGNGDGESPPHPCQVTWLPLAWQLLTSPA